MFQQKSVHHVVIILHLFYCSNFDGAGREKACFKGMKIVHSFFSFADNNNYYYYYVDFVDFWRRKEEESIAATHD